jgi:hypothetical protein
MTGKRFQVSLVVVGVLVLAVPAMAQGTPDEAAEFAAVAAWVASPVFAPVAPPPPPRNPLATVFFSNFDTDNGGLVGNLDWQWGATYAWAATGCDSTPTPPAAAYSGTGMWGTVLNGCYANRGNNTGYATCSNTTPGDDSILTLTVDLTNHSAATLSWYEWTDVFSNWDWVEVRVNGTSVFAPCPPSFVAPTAWVQQTVSLTPFVGGVVTIEWHLLTSTVVNHAGWYIDDVLVDGTPVPVELQSLTID